MPNSRIQCSSITYIVFSVFFAAQYIRQLLAYLCWK
jgi:hypothetical protein